MKKVLLILLLGTVFTACNSVKVNQKHIDNGNYNEAISVAIKQLQKSKTSSKSDAHIVLLEKAFKKAVDKDKNDISFYKKQHNPAEAKNTYYKYKGLIDRQATIQQLLPLYSTSLKRNAKFKMENYSDKFAVAKQNYSDYLYDMGITYMKFNNTLDFRKAYDVFNELSGISPNYEDTYNLKEEAYFKGTDFIFVQLINRTFQIIPRDLESSLLSFNTSDLGNYWTEFHSQRQKDISYNYGVDLFFETIEFSPERIKEEEIKRSRRIKDGWEYQKDRNGNFVLDDKGNKIKKDIYITVKATLYQTVQTKSVLVGSTTVFKDFTSKREINRFPLTTEFVFENIFATYRGDKRALSTDDLNIIRNKFVYFPKNEQMLFDAGEDLKLQLITILKDNSFR